MIIRQQHKEKVSQFLDKFQLNSFYQDLFNKTITKNSEDSGRYKHDKKNVKIFRDNLLRLIDLTNTVTNDENQTIALQINTGIIDVGDFILIHADKLKATMGNFSHSSINNYLSAIGCREVKGAEKNEIVHRTFLNNYKFLIRKWSVRSKPITNDNLGFSTQKRKKAFTAPILLPQMVNLMNDTNKENIQPRVESVNKIDLSDALGSINPVPEIPLKKPESHE